MRLGFVTAAIILVLDQLSKNWLIGLMAEEGPRALTPFFNLVMVWNRGVSFGFLNAATTPALQQWLLIGMSLAMTGLLLVWLKKADQALLRLALGGVIGGALGNAIDRLRFGAVADFFDFHAFGYHWPAFNIADSAIVMGVVVLLWDGLFGGPKAHKIGP